MPSFVTALLMTTFFFAGLAIALPIIDKLGGVRLPRTRRPASVRDQAAVVVTGPAFTPLEMADSGQRWPSNIPDRRKRLVMPPWPSETWKDNPFPASAAIAKQVKDAAPHSQGTPAATAQRQIAADDSQAPVQTRRKAKARRPSKARPQPKRARKHPTRRQPEQQAHSEQARPESRPAPQQPAVRPMTPQPQGGAPEAAILLEIANDPSRGLAAAVDVVRQTTGWSFQRAAQHVATVLRSNS